MKRFEKTSAFRYMHKDHDDKVFILEKVNENSCTFVHTPLFDAKLQIDAPFADCKNWKKTKKEIPQLAPPAIVASKTAAKTGQLEGDYLKAFVQTLVMEAYFDNSPCQALQYSVSPAGVYTSAKLKKQELLLYPVGTVQVVKLEDVSKIKNIHLQLHGHHFQLSPPKALSKFSDDGTGHLVPWFWVQTVEEPEEANMVLKMKDYKGLSLPVLTNDKPLGPNVQLVKATEESLAAISVQPKKKAKRS